MTCCVLRRVVSLLFVSLLLWPAPNVWANNVPVDGVFVPWGSIADHDDAVSFRLNTASTGFQEGWIFSLTHTGLRVPWEPTAAQDPSLNGDGLALFWSQRFLGLLSTSVGLQYLYPDSANAAGEQLGAHLRASLGSAVLIHPTLSTSLTAHLLIGDEVGFSNLFQFDVGLLWRPLNILSVGVNVRNVLAPRFGTVVTPRTWEVGLSIRPLSNARLSLSADVSLPETTGRIDFRYRLEGEPLHGWVVCDLADSLGDSIIQLCCLHR